MGALGSLASVGLNVALADQAQKRESKKINDERDDEIEEIERRNAEEQRRVADRLRQQLATQRARAGAAGIGGSATSNAILRGLAAEAATANQSSQQDANRSITTLNRNARNARRSNLLDLASGSARQGISLLSSGSSSSLFDL